MKNVGIFVGIGRTKDREAPYIINGFQILFESLPGSQIGPRSRKASGAFLFRAHLYHIEIKGFLSHLRSFKRLSA
jgi:hypothetical protein